jgi:hypothetical protein
MQNNIARVISQTEAATLIRNSGGKFFGVTFVKRGDRKKMGKGVPYNRLPRRRLTGRTGVTQDVTGAGKKFNDRDHNLLTVREFVVERATTPHARKNLLPTVATTDMQWRAVPIEGIEELRIGGKVFQVR